VAGLQKLYPRNSFPHIIPLTIAFRPFLQIVFTIHNLNYGKKKISEAAYYCQKFTTVSPTYAFETGEILYRYLRHIDRREFPPPRVLPCLDICRFTLLPRFAATHPGGNPVIASQTHKFIGIRNGIDPELWDPENNQWLPVGYSSKNVVEGKAAARKASVNVMRLTFVKLTMKFDLRLRFHTNHLHLCVTNHPLTPPTPPPRHSASASVWAAGATNSSWGWSAA
jgi:hypothetical protein